MRDDIGRVISQSANLLECLCKWADPHDVQAAVHDAWLRLSESGSPMTVGWVVQAAKMLLRKRHYRKARRERMRVPMPALVYAKGAGDPPAEYPAVAAVAERLTVTQADAMRSVLAGEPLKGRAIREWGNGRAKMKRHLTPDGDYREGVQWRNREPRVET